MHLFLLNQQIDELLGTSLTTEDEDAVLQELEELTNAQAASGDVKLPDAPTTEPQDLEAPSLPDVPSAGEFASTQTHRQGVARYLK